MSMVLTLNTTFKEQIKTFKDSNSLTLVKIAPPLYVLRDAFWRQYHHLNATEYLERNELEELQFESLKNLINHAYESVPYYRWIFKKLGLHPRDIKDIEKFKELPKLDKATFKRYKDYFYSSKVNPRMLIPTHTSGTTGTPLQFHWAPDEPWKEWAFVLHQWRRVGYTPFSHRVEIRGPIIDPWTKIEFTGMGSIRLSPLIKSVQQAEYYLKIMKESRIPYIHGYPSAIASLAKIVHEYGLDADRIHVKAVLLASEAVYHWQIELIEKVFRAKTFSFYGMTEHVALAAWCEYSRKYHFVPQYGFVEIDPKTGEIIGTGFLNYAVPFIRYRTTDVAVNWSYTSKCKCGRNYFPIVDNIAGRFGDVLIDSNGIIISPTVITHPLKDLKTVNAVQIIQEDYEYIIVKLEPIPSLDISKAEVEIIINHLKRLLGSDARIEVHIENIPRGLTGKFKWIISRVARKEVESNNLGR